MREANFRQNTQVETERVKFEFRREANSTYTRTNGPGKGEKEEK